MRRKRKPYKPEPSERSRQFTRSGLVGWTITGIAYIVWFLKYYVF